MPVDVTKRSSLSLELAFPVACGDGQHDVSVWITAWGLVDVRFNPCTILPRAARRFSKSSCQQPLQERVDAIHGLLQYCWCDDEPVLSEELFPARVRTRLLRFLERVRRKKRSLADDSTSSVPWMDMCDWRMALGSPDPSVQWRALVLAGVQDDPDVAAELSDHVDTLPFGLQLAAVCTLNDSEDPGYVPLIGQWLVDDRVVPPLRERFARTLGQFGDDEAVLPLKHALMADATAVNWAAHEALRRLFWRLVFEAPPEGDERLANALHTALDERDSQSRNRLIGLLADVGRRLVPELGNVLKTGEPAARAGAAEALGRIGDIRAADSLIGAIDDDDIEVCVKTAEAFFEIVSSSPDRSTMPVLRRAVPPLIRALDGREPQLEATAAKTLRKIITSHDNDAFSLEVLKRTIRAPHVAVAMTSARKLGEINTAEAVQVLVHAIERPEEEVRSVAIAALRKVKDPRALVPLLDCLPRCVSTMREHVAEIARQLVRAGCGHVPSDLGVLARALAAPEASIAIEAARAMGIIRDPRFVGPLFQACLRGHSELSSVAGNSLRRIDTRTVVPHLTRVLRDGDRVMAVGAEEALIAIGSPAVASLKKALKWKYVKARLAAARALGRIGDARAIPALRSAVNDRDVHVRQVANVAMRSIETGRLRRR